MPYKKLLLKFSLGFFVLSFFLFSSPQPTLAFNPFTAIYNYLVGKPAPATPTPIPAPLSAVPPVLPETSSSPVVYVAEPPINTEALAAVLRNLLKQKEFTDQLRGPSGSQGIQGPSGPSGPAGISAPYFAPLAPPSYAPPNYNQNQIVGNSGGFASLGVQDLIATTARVTGATTLATLAVDSITSGATTLSGLLSFTGTDHAGIKINNLTTTERDLLTPASGMTIFNTTVSKMQVYNGTTWKNVGNPEIGAEVTSGTSGSVLFVDSSGNLAQDNANFFFNDTTNTLNVKNNANFSSVNTTDSTTAFNFGETTAATNGTSTSGVPNQVLGKFSTLASSTASPLSVYSRGSHVFSVSPSTAQILATSGTAALPSYAFSSGTTTGIFRSTFNTTGVGFTAGGTQILEIGNNFISFLNGSSCSAPLITTGAVRGNDGFNIQGDNPELCTGGSRVLVANGTIGVGVGDLQNTSGFGTFSVTESGGTVTNSAPVFGLEYYAANSTGNIFVARKSRGSAGSASVITTGDDLLQINGLGYVGATNTYKEAAQILFDSTGTIADTTSGIGGQIKFLTTKAGTDTTPQLALTISGGSTPQLLTADGSVSAPAYSFTNDSDLGITRFATNAMGFVTGGYTSAVIGGTGAIFTGNSNLNPPPAAESTLHLATNNQADAGTILTIGQHNNTGTLSSGPRIFAKQSRGQYNGPTGTVTGDDLLTIAGYGYVGVTNTYQEATQILFDSTGTISDSASGIGGEIKFLTTKAGTDTTPQLALTINGGSTPQLLAANGAATAPAYSFSSDPDTGIRSVSANVMGLQAAGESLVRVTNISSTGIISAVLVDNKFPGTNMDQSAVISSASISVPPFRGFIARGDTLYPTQMTFLRSRGDNETPSVITSGDPLGGISAFGFVGTTQDFEEAASIIFESAGTISDSTTGIAGVIRFLTADTGGEPTERLTLLNTGNLKLAGTAVRGTTEGTNHLDIFNGTAPVGTLTNGISLYSSGGEAFVIDAGGTATQFSPHDEQGYWVYNSTNSVENYSLLIDMEKMMKQLNNTFGWDFVHETIDGVLTLPDNTTPLILPDTFFSAITNRLVTWLADAGNGITKIFTGEIDTKNLCVSDNNGARTCIDKSQLDALIAGAGGSIVDNSGGSPTATCSDGIQNQNETGIDAGGVCAQADTTAPVITLTGDAIIDIIVDSTYEELGATVTDDVDTSMAVIISGIVDTATVGTYTITYNATDTAGNPAVEITRTVNVNAVVPPEEPAP